jgi:hypothetical protein
LQSVKNDEGHHPVLDDGPKGSDSSNCLPSPSSEIPDAKWGNSRDHTKYLRRDYKRGESWVQVGDEQHSVRPREYYRGAERAMSQINRNGGENKKEL